MRQIGKNMRQIGKNRAAKTAAWLVLGISITQLRGGAAPAPAAGFISHVAVSPAVVKSGKPAAFSVSLVNQSAVVSGGNVDLEVYNAQKKRVAQQVWSGQMLPKGKSSVYHWVWKPAVAGVYTIKLGIFSGNWKTMHYWMDKAQTVKVS